MQPKRFRRLPNKPGLAGVLWISFELTFAAGGGWEWSLCTFWDGFTELAPKVDPFFLSSDLLLSASEKLKVAVWKGDVVTVFPVLAPLLGNSS